jgi:general secretion pathway protein N
MAHGKRLIAAGAAALVAALLVTFPARIAYQWFGPPEVALSGISGSIWNGAAVEGDVAGLYFRDFSWRLRPLSLFALKAAFAVAASPPAGFVEADVVLGFGGDVSIADLAAAASLASVSSFLPLNGVEGDLNLQFDRLVLHDGFPTEADGTLGISGLVVRALSPAALGDYRATVQTADGRIDGVVEDVSGVLQITGRLTVGRDRSYSFVGQVAANADAPGTLVQQLQFLGSPDQQGRREFRFEGRL